MNHKHRNPITTVYATLTQKKNPCSKGYMIHTQNNPRTKGSKTPKHGNNKTLHKPQAQKS